LLRQSIRPKQASYHQKLDEIKGSDGAFSQSGWKDGHRLDT
jgi:hypothetical protein